MLGNMLGISCLRSVENRQFGHYEIRQTIMLRLRNPRLCASVRRFSERKLRSDETPHPRMYSHDHPAFPTKKELARKERLAYGLSAVITFATFYLAYAYAQPVKAEALADVSNVDDKEKAGITEVSMSQRDLVKQSRMNPGVYIWGSNKQKIVNPDSSAAVIANPTALEVGLFLRRSASNRSSSSRGKRYDILHLAITTALL
jgi:hypothetical protein